MNLSEIRHSRAGEINLISDSQDLARQEALNGLRQFDATVEMIEGFLGSSKPFRLRPSHLLRLNRFALENISPYAGNWRPATVEIDGSQHRPIPSSEVPEMIEELCDYVAEHWTDRHALHLSAYVMWRLNWIHPFADGNGRTSRAASYLVLCLRLGYLLPGNKSIPEQISANREAYYKALEVADQAWVDGKVDLTDMENLLSAMLVKQLSGGHENTRM